MPLRLPRSASTQNTANAPLPLDFPPFINPSIHRKDQKKVDKLEAQIPYHEGRGNKDEVDKIKGQIAAIWEKAKEAQFA